MSECRSVAVLGAGAAAARRRAQAGLSVRIFDKGRGVGGRMAARRVEGLPFDHGAPFLGAQGEAFAARIADWEGGASSRPGAAPGDGWGCPA